MHAFFELMWRFRRGIRCIINAAVEEIEYSNTVNKKLRHWIWFHETRVHPPYSHNLSALRSIPASNSHLLCLPSVYFPKSVATNNLNPLQLCLQDDSILSFA